MIWFVMMYEREFNSDDRAPRLEVDDIQRLKNVIEEKGALMSGIFFELPPIDETIFYTYSLNADLVDEHWHNITRSGDRKITNVTLEYNKHFVDDEGVEIPSAVAIEIGGLLYDSGEVINSEVRYLLSLEGGESFKISETCRDSRDVTISDDDFDSLSEEEVAKLLELRAARRRILTDKDVQLIKLIISLLPPVELS